MQKYRIGLTMGVLFCLLAIALGDHIIFDSLIMLLCFASYLIGRRFWHKPVFRIFAITVIAALFVILGLLIWSHKYSRSHIWDSGVPSYPTPTGL